MRRARVLSLLSVLLVAGWIPARGQSISETFKKVRDSVVVIETTEEEITSWSRGMPVKMGGMGSGVLVDSLGMVLTAAHVVQTAEEVRVRFSDGEVYNAKVYASAPGADVAVLKLERPPTSGVVAKLGDSDAVEVGDQVFIVGAPHGISYTLTVGHISARRAPNSLWGGLNEAELLQTDAAINQGNSGGPMFNTRGEVIGIVSHMISQSGGFEGLGFVVTSNLARELVLEQKSMWSGIDGYLLSDELARAFNLPQPAGVLVQKVVKNSPGSRMGLKPGTLHAEIEGETLMLGGDVVLDVMGIRIDTADSLEKIRSTLASLVPGEKIAVTVLRGGERVELSAVPLERY